MSNVEVLKTANAAVSRGEYEEFLKYCTDDVTWTFVGEQVLRGKSAIEEYMRKTYLNPPQFDVKRFIKENDSLVAMGNISMEDAEGKVSKYSYCDVWEFRDGKMAELTAYVVEVFN